MTDEKEIDIVKQLEAWEGRDDVREELNQILSMAADEIRGLRAELEHLRNIIEDASPRF